ncbi:MAG: N-acetyltransferase family protein [Halobacterium sp.]
MPSDAAADGACSAWDNGDCEGTPYCQPRCPRAFDDDGRPFVVRPVEAGDTDGLVSMYDAMSAETSTLGLPPRTRERTERWLAGLRGDGVNLVAVADGQVVGHAAAAPADDPDPELVVFVHPAHRGRGVGTELLKHLIAHVDDRGCASLRLTVSEDNDRAVHVYDNLGFDVSERLRAELRMRLSLDDPLVDLVQRPPARRPTE